MVRVLASWLDAIPKHISNARNVLEEASAPSYRRRARKEVLESSDDADEEFHPNNQMLVKQLGHLRFRLSWQGERRWSRWRCTIAVQD